MIRSVEADKRTPDQQMPAVDIQDPSSIAARRDLVRARAMGEVARKMRWRLADDVGTEYVMRGVGSGSASSWTDLQVDFHPAPPPNARTLTVTTPDDLEVVVPLDSRTQLPFGTTPAIRDPSRTRSACPRSCTPRRPSRHTTIQLPSPSRQDAPSSPPSEPLRVVDYDRKQSDWPRWQRPDRTPAVGREPG